MAEGGWLYEKDGETLGPVSRAGLLALLESGELPPEARVRPEGEHEWRSACAAESLAQAPPAKGAPEDPGIGKFRETCLGCFVLILLAAGIVWFFYTGEPAPPPEPPEEQAAAAPEPEPQPPRELSPEEIAALAEKATVYVECFVKERDTFFNDDAALYGSGVLFRRDGLRYDVLTNARTLGVHWMLESDGNDPPEILDYQLRVTFFDDVSGVVAGVAVHPALKDYAIVTVEVPRAHYPVLPFAVEEPAVGERIYTMGHPGGLTYTFASGVVSQLRSIASLSVEGVPVAVLQHDAPAEEGSAGGPLINRRGELIGINAVSPAERVNLAVSVADIQRALDGARFLTMPLEPEALTGFLRRFFDES